MIVGIDVGFSAVKVIGRDKRAIFPSVVGTPRPEASYTINGVKGLAVRQGPAEYVPVGDTALLQSRYTAGRRDSGWVLDNEWETLFLAGLGQVFDAPFMRMKVVTGLPVYDWQTYAGKLREKLEDQFTFQCLGRHQQTVEIAEALVVTQPYGSLLSMAVGATGKVLGNVWSSEMVAVADLGGNTLNLLVVDQLEEVSRLTLSDEFGLLHALDGVRDDIRRDLSRFDPSTHEVAGWLAKGGFQYRGERVKVWPYAKKHLEPLIDLVMTRMDEAWPESSRFAAVLLTGGGSAAIGRYLRSRMENNYGTVEIAEDPRWANAVGYERLGRLVFE
jgi:hypothetical protein